MSVLNFARWADARAESARRARERSQVHRLARVLRDCAADLEGAEPDEVPAKILGAMDALHDAAARAGCLPERRNSDRVRTAAQNLINSWPASWRECSPEFRDLRAALTDLRVMR